MLRETLARADADLVVMAAAVADYRPAAARQDKRPKDEQPWTVELEPTTDILKTLGARRTNGQVLVGFAADHGDAGLARAHEKLKRKGADIVVFNDVSRGDIGFDAPDNEVVILTRERRRTIEKAPKRTVAAAILDEAATLLEDRHGRSGR